MKLGLGLLISAAFLWATLRTVPLGRVAQVLADADWRWLLLALLSLGCGYWLRISRWTVMLRILGSRVTVAQAAVPFLGSVAFNNVLPFRAGDVIRVIASERFVAVAPSMQLGSIVLERLLDLGALMAILFVTLTLADGARLDPVLLHGLQLAALAMVAAVAMFVAAPGPIRFVVRWADARYPRLAPLGQALLRLSDAIAALVRPALLLRLLGLTLLSWLCEGGAFLFTAFALGLPLPVAGGLLALCVGTLSTMIPSSPGYVGTFHFFTTRVVAQFGVTIVPATAYAILIHALLWLSTTSVGFALLGWAGWRRRPSSAVAGTGAGAAN